MRDKSRRFLFLGMVNLAVLHGLTMLVDARWDGISQYVAFAHALIAGMAAKGLGDLLYYIFSPSRRPWTYFDDYLLGDFLVHIRFVFPLACFQAWSANTVLIFWPVVRRLCLSPIAGVLVWAVNRWLVEEAEDKRSRPLGGGAAQLTR